MSTDENEPQEEPSPDEIEEGVGPIDERAPQLTPIESELKDSYLSYAMSVIISRALPDARDGLKPSQRRILVAMNDLGLTSGAERMKCAKVCGDTSGNYHPHGEGGTYPTLVRMGQNWNMRYVLVDKKGNFGSIQGLEQAAMRYTEARMSIFATMMMDDLKSDTVEYVSTYDGRRTEPTVLPSRFPNFLVNGASGIAVGMATSVPPHNLGEVCDALIRVLDDPDVSVDELLEIVPGPDFPTGGVVCGRSGIRKAYHTGRSTITLRGRAKVEEYGKGRQRIVITELPYQHNVEAMAKRIEDVVKEEKVKGIADLHNYSNIENPVHIVVDVKRDADAEVVLNQLFEFTPLQSTFSVIFLALVDGRPRVLSFKAILEEFIRHRITIVRRRTQFALSKSRQRKHIVEGLLLSLADIDEVIRVIRESSTQAEAKVRLMGIVCPAALMKRCLGDDGFRVFQSERGVAEGYNLTAVQADAILRMTLGQLVNLEQEKLTKEHQKLLAHIAECEQILSDIQNVRNIVKEELQEIKKKYADPRRTEITGEEVGSIDLEDLIEEEPMVVTISHQGYIKRIAAKEYRAQRRGGKGIKGTKSVDEDPVRHMFAASTHDYLLFFTNKGKVYWQKVYGIPELSRESRGRAIVNLLNLTEEEHVTDCRAIRDFSLPDHFLIMATRKGLVKKTALDAYSRPLKNGLIAIKLREDDELVDVTVTRTGDDIVLATASGMAIRFNQQDSRAMGRNTSGVKGISLRKGDSLVGMVVADPEATLLTVSRNGYGKRTPFGPNEVLDTVELPEEGVPEEEAPGSDVPGSDVPGSEALPGDTPAGDAAEGEAEEEGGSSTFRYRTQRRAGKGVRDIKTSDRNGPVVGIVSVRDDDELLMVTAGGKIQRIKASDISVIGRNTQGVRVMSLDDGDTLVAVARAPREENGEDSKDSSAETQ